MNSLNLYNKEHETNNKITLEDPSVSNKYELPKLTGSFNIVKKVLDKPLKLTVGSGGDFTDLVEAFEYAKGFNVEYLRSNIKSTNNHIMNNPLVTIEILPNHKLIKPFYLNDGGDYRHIQILSESETIVSREAALDARMINGIYGFFAIAGSFSPVIKGKFTMDNSGRQSTTGGMEAIMFGVYGGGYLKITPGSIIKGGYYVLFCSENATISAFNTTLIGLSNTTQIVRMHSGSVDISRCILRYDENTTPGTHIYGSNCCFHISEGGDVRFVSNRFENAPYAIESFKEHTVVSPKFVNIKDAVLIGLGLIVLTNPDLSEVGTGKLIYNNNTANVIGTDGLFLRAR